MPVAPTPSPRAHRSPSLAAVPFAARWLIFLLLAAGLTTPAMAEPTTLRGNGIAVVIDPAIGRITSFRGPDGTERLWRATPQAVAEARARGGWINHGGDKVWVSIQALWPIIQQQRAAWPPDPAIDGRPWQIVTNADSDAEASVTMRSPAVDSVGVVAERTVRLTEGSVRIDNRIRRVARNPHAVHAWSVTQVPVPRYVLVDLMADRPIVEPYVWVSPPGQDRQPDIEPVADGRALLLRPRSFESAKPGVFGRWVAAVYDDAVLVQRHPVTVDAHYPERSSITVYSAAEYVELETLSPAAHLLLGQSMEHPVTWTLLPPPAPDADPHTVARDLIDRLSTGP